MVSVSQLFPLMVWHRFHHTLQKMNLVFEPSSLLGVKQTVCVLHGDDCFKDTHTHTLKKLCASNVTFKDAFP